MKVVYNSRHGGFSLSTEGIAAYAARKGITLYLEDSHYGLTVYWTVPADQRSGILRDDEWHTADMDARRKSNELYARMTLDDRSISRSDPELVAVVEAMGDAASGTHASLRIAEVETGKRWRIDEYDGAETVMTVDDYEWHIAD